MMINKESKDIIENQILRSNKAIERHIDHIEIDNRSLVSQDILTDLRTFIQWIMLRIYANDNDVNLAYGNTYNELKVASKNCRIKFLKDFFEYIEIVNSHYTLEPESAERVMLKYMEYLVKIKKLGIKELKLSLLNNLEKFPLNLDKNLQSYYKEISKKIGQQKFNIENLNSNRYYIHKIKPFFVEHEIYYEVTFTLANENSNKSDRVIAFTKLDISGYYATKLWLSSESIKVLNCRLPILIIEKWEVAIRPIEIENLGKIFGANLKSAAGSAEGRGLMSYLTETGNSLIDLITTDEVYFNDIKQRVMEKYNAKVSNIFDVLTKCREIILGDNPGANVLRYLLLHLNNKILKLQIRTIFNDNKTGNNLLSHLNLEYGCKPFDEMPFDSSLIGHNPKLDDLFECIDSTNRKHELVARFIKQNTEQNGILYTSKKDLENFGDVEQLINVFNSNIYRKHRPNRNIEKFCDHYYIHGDQESTIKTLDILRDLSKKGVSGYENYVDKWLLSDESNVDDDEKKDALKKMFVSSCVALIYGSAGTGKTTLINHISTLFKNYSRLYLAQTNPAVDNMRRRIVSKGSETSFSTVTKFLKQNNNRIKYDILVIDECSTIGNVDIEKVLEKAKVKLIILVGDTYQIESIRFGNWFSLAKKFFEKSAIELKKPYRSSNTDLLTFWEKVRTNSTDIQEIDARLQYSSDFDPTIFKQSSQDEIVLCLNYDGLYGINNINTLLQENNTNEAVKWGLKSYKVGDPVLFNDSERFKPIIYNNLKGWIKAVQIIKDKIQFDIEIDKSITELDISGNNNLQLIEDDGTKNSIIRFTVDNYQTLDENDGESDSTIVPFQTAYAVSIHKSQGLEYDSVKILITDEVEEKITHCIFYTAITRAKKNLKIYWSPEVEQRIISQLRPRDINKDFNILNNKISSKQ